MKLSFKTTLVIASITGLLNSPLALADDSAKPAAASQQKNSFKNDDQTTAYALGASFGLYLDNSLQQQNELGVTLDRKMLLQGLQDGINNKSLLSNEEIRQTLLAFDDRMKQAEQKKKGKLLQENEQKGQAFRTEFSKKSGVKKTASGLLYKVEKPGSGEPPKDNDTVVVNYSGSLIDGQQFDSSYQRKEPLSFRVDGVIPGWTEGLKLIGKGGKIELVIPPELAYGEDGIGGTIPPNSTLVFQVELLDIKPAKPASTEKFPAEKKAKPSTSDKP